MDPVAGFLHFTDAVVNDQPTVPGQDWRSAASDFEALPRGHRSCEPVMRKLVDVIWPTGLEGKRAVGNPDAFAIKVHFTGRFIAGGFLGTSSGKQRPVEDREFRFAAWIRNGNGEYAGVFVIHLAGIDAMIRSKGRQPQALPGEKVLRDRPGDSRAAGRKRGVSHHVAL